MTRRANILGPGIDGVDPSSGVAMIMKKKSGLRVDSFLTPAKHHSVFRTLRIAEKRVEKNTAETKEMGTF